MAESTLLDKLASNGLINEKGDIILVQGEGGSSMTVPVSTFQIFFGTSETYEQLVGTHTFTWNDESLTKTTEDLGYKVIFDAWKEKGII